jgi:hypothetical protein
MLSLLGSLQTEPFSGEHGGLGGKSDLGESEMDDIEVEREIEASASSEESDRERFGGKRRRLLK